QTTSVADSSMPVGIYDYNTAANLAVDWVFVRNYVSPEPSWGVWGTEQASQNGGAPSITGLPQESQVSDIVGAIRTFNITANQAVNVTWYLNSVIIKDTEKSVTQATYTNTSASMGAWNVSAVVSNTNGSAIQTWTWDVSSTNAASGIFFTDPTPANGAILNQNYAYINTTVLDFNTAFIDWNHSLAGWWRFNSESGENAAFFRDWSSRRNNGTCSGTSCPFSTPGKFGNAMSFDGSNDYITILNSASLNPSYITVETWFNAVPGSLSYQKSLVQKPYTSHANPYYQYMLSLIDRTTSPKEATFYITLNGVLHEVGATNLNYGYGQWHYLAGTYDGSNIALYLDGVPVATKAVSGTMNSYNTVIQFGSYPNLGKTSNYVFNGKIDEVRIHNRALNPEEIRASYNTGIYRLYNNFTNLPYGTYAYTAYVQNLAGDVNQTETRTVTSFLPDVPVIIGFAPLSPLTNSVGDSRTFNITMNKPVNVTWYLNGVVIKNIENGVTQASYSNTSASQGTWIVNATATDTNGTVSKEWTWNVTSQSPSEIKSITVSPSDISVIRRGTMQLDIPTYDGSGQAVHPDVYYNANGWRGYKYWMVMTPYPNGNDAYENPSILVSNDGISWSVPQGLQNPIDPQPASGSNSDVDIVYNETADRIEIYYVESGAGTSYLIRKTSSDGITWSAEKNTMLVPDYQVMSPAIIKNGSVYDMWYTGGASCSADT
ncbi:MAG: LamG domain-containing protein, partial [Candidatus Methanoperedens sp.]|nr:LamG domain-containing protein [Candidatus Methanoperedens sp.]